MTTTRVPRRLSPFLALLAILAFASVPAVAAAEKPTVESESASEVLAAGARLEARVTPNGSTLCHFQYGVAFVSENEVPCEPEEIEGSAGTIGATVTGLAPVTTYHYRVILTNTSGTTEGPPEEFTTTAPPEMPEGLKAEVTATGVKLEGILNPDKEGSPGGYEFLYKQSATECHGEGNHELATPEQPATGKEKEKAEGEVKELLPNTQYTFCLVALTGGEKSELSTSVTLTTPAVAPTVGEESFSNVGSSSATLHANLDPGGALTSYFFEYGTTEAYGLTTPVQSAGAGAEPVGVLAIVEGLQAGTVYHFRLVVSNGKVTSPVPGADDSFSTFPAGILGLPDNRGFELVSPLNNGDGTVLFGRRVRAAADGSAVAYDGTAPPTSGNGTVTLEADKRPLGTNVYLAKRATNGGWTVADIQPNADIAPDLEASALYQGFSSDLSTGFLGSGRPLASDGAADGEEGPAGLYSRNSGGGYSLLAENASYAGSTPDGSHVLAKSTAGLYDSVGGRLETVSVLPAAEGGSVVTDAVFGSTNPSVGTPADDLERVISNDGSRIFWTDLTTGALYVRENDAQPDASTLLIAEDAQYQTASSDGSKVFFTDEKQLTNPSSAATGAPDLYEYDLDTGKFTDLSVNSSQGEHTNVVGVLGASEDGSYIYFAAAGTLAVTGAAQQTCTPGNGSPSNKCNVYVVHDGEAKLVAVVAAADGMGGIHGAGVIAYELEEQFFGDWTPYLGDRSAHVTPDGLHLAFESIEDLISGFQSGRGREIYLYDYGSGRTSCVSCNPSGAPTVHGTIFGYAHAELQQSFASTYGLRDISADGSRVFFESNEALTSQNTNEEAFIPDYHEETGLTNVYEWERADGSSSESEPNNSCTQSSPSFSAVDQGCIFLLSTGTSSDASFFIDASESGNDVFIGTRADLVPQDKGETYEVYDARVGATQPATEPACTGTGCQGLPTAPPIFATPSSVTFNGIGNFPAPGPVVVKKAAKKVVRCAKGRKLSKGRCVKRAKSRAKRRRAKKKG